MDELITIVDDKDNVVGIATRQEAHQRSLWHRIVVVFIFNSQGQLFIQKRSPGLVSQPGKWDHSVAGHVDAGESSQAAARRELLEELGIKTTNLQFLYAYRVCLREKEMIFNRFWHTFKCIHSGPFHLRPDEISEGKFVSLSWLSHDMKKHSDIYTNGFHESLKRYLKYVGRAEINKAQKKLSKTRFFDLVDDIQKSNIGKNAEKTMRDITAAVEKVRRSRHLTSY